jgi:hypothetical protein
MKAVPLAQGRPVTVAVAVVTGAASVAAADGADAGSIPPA